MIISLQQQQATSLIDFVQQDLKKFETLYRRIGGFIIEDLKKHLSRDTMPFELFVQKLCYFQLCRLLILYLQNTNIATRLLVTLWLS